MNDHDMLQQIYNDVHALNQKYDDQKDATHSLDKRMAEGFAKSVSDHKHLYDKVQESNDVQNTRLKEHGEQIDELTNEVASLKGKLRFAYAAALVLSPIIASVVVKYMPNFG